MAGKQSGLRAEGSVPYEYFNSPRKVLDAVVDIVPPFIASII